MADGAPLSRDRLIDELWGDRPPSSAVSALHVHLSKLRELLGDLVERDAAGYSLRAGEFELDALEFDALVEQARTDPDQARTLLRQALALVRGEPLSDVAAEGSIATWRRGLEEKCLQAQLMRVDADLAAGAAGELVAELESLVAAHPYEERLWGQLMLALYRSGRQADALDAFARARRAFAAELGLEPGEQLVRLHSQMLQRDSSLLPAEADAGTAEPVSARPPEPAPRPASNLPAAVTRMVGRERELALMQTLLAERDVRVTTLIGAGGVGKTRLAIELARRIEPNYRDGAVLVRLERLTDPALVAAEIASALGQRSGTDGPGADGLARYLRDMELLLVIDNFEHLLPAALLISELLELAPQIQVLVSSRTALRIRGERLFAVEPLGLPEGASDEEIAESPAVQLFTDRARAAAPDLTLDEEGYRTVADICRALDGLPLAIELAASRCHLMSVADMRQQLSRPLLIGERSLRDLPDRQQTLRATIGWSYDLLTDPAQEVLRDAGAFIGGFTLAALEAVVGRSAVIEIGELQESSLVRRQSDEGRLELLELLRAFARDKSREAGEAESVGARHRRYFTQLIAPASDDFEAGTAVGQISVRFRADHANVREAFADAVEQGDQESAVTVALGLRPLWIAGNLRQESGEFAEQLLDHFEIPGEAEMALLRVVSALENPAAKWQRRYADRAAELGDQEALGVATTQLFVEATQVRDRQEMDRLHPVLVSLITPETSPRVLGWVFYSLWGESYLNGDYEQAFEYASSSVERARELGHSYMLICALEAQLLAESAARGEITHAHLVEVFELARGHGVHSVAVAALWFVARYAAAVDREAARRWLTLAERVNTEYDAAPSLEEVLRAETMEVLEITDMGPLLAAAPPFDPAHALDEVAEWLASRSPDEVAKREPVLSLG
jgi:predicted ATPase/DNA-binding SARP family transcriptional activator